jgi:hypothetical protein
MRERSTYYEVERPIVGVEPIRYSQEADVAAYRVEVGAFADVVLTVRAAEIEEMGFNKIGTMVRVRVETI